MKDRDLHAQDVFEEQVQREEQSLRQRTIPLHEFVLDPQRYMELSKAGDAVFVTLNGVDRFVITTFASWEEKHFAHIEAMRKAGMLTKELEALFTRPIHKGPLN